MKRVAVNIFFVTVMEQSRCDYQDRSQYIYLKNMMMSRVWGAKSASSLSSRKKSRSEFWVTQAKLALKMIALYISQFTQKKEKSSSNIECFLNKIWLYLILCLLAPKVPKRSVWANADAASRLIFRNHVYWEPCSVKQTGRTATSLTGMLICHKVTTRIW